MSEALRTIAGSIVTPEREEFAQHQMLLLGIPPGEAAYEGMLDAARRGWPAWRIAQAYLLSPATVHALGGPEP